MAKKGGKIPLPSKGGGTGKLSHAPLRKVPPTMNTKHK
jgi:hypothetical protein